MLKFSSFYPVDDCVRIDISPVLKTQEGGEQGISTNGCVKAMTDSQNFTKNDIIKFCTLGILLLMAGILVLLLSGALFALLFDRTDIFFGLHLDGWAALASLLSKAVVEFVLLSLIVRYPARLAWFVKISLVFSGLLLADSVLMAMPTLQENQKFSPVPGILFLLSIGLVILCHRQRMNEPECE